MLDAYDIARLEGFAGTREEFLRLEYLRGGIDTAKAAGFEGEPAELATKMHQPSTAAAMALLDMLKGDTGPQGPKGERGETGSDLYQLAQQSGFVGTLDEYLASLKGETGPQGKPGPQGQSGLKGIKGDPGNDGKDGADGQAPAHQIDGNRVRFEQPSGEWGAWIDLGGIAQVVNSMGAGSLQLQKFYDSVAEFPAVGKTQLLYFDTSASPYGSYVWTGTEYKSVGAGADLLKDWDFYATNWSVTPSLVSTMSGGKVYEYTLQGTTRYRFVPSPYLPTGDIFYDSFSFTPLAVDSGSITSDSTMYTVDADQISSSFGAIVAVRG
jgi:hypothetical protein